MNQKQNNRHKKNAAVPKLFLGASLLLMSAFLAVVCFTLSPDDPHAVAPSNSSGAQTSEAPSSEATSPATQSAPPTQTEAPTNADKSETTAQTKPASSAAQSEKSDDSYGVFNPNVIAVSSQNWELTLVNTKYRLPAGYEPPKLTAVFDCRLDSRVAPYYMKMYNAAEKEGIELKPFSGFRTYERQKTNYENKINYYVGQGYNEKDAAIKASMWIMPPGSSEHNLGFAMDIDSTNTDFEETADFTWLRENAYKYGFIMRYAKEKTDITGVNYEPWHWRYVGVKAATELFNKRDENGLEPCLEEYLGRTD